MRKEQDFPSAAKVSFWTPWFSFQGEDEAAEDEAKKNNLTLLNVLEPLATVSR